MEQKELINKAIVDVSEEKPKDFMDKIETVFKDKLKNNLSSAVKAEEEKIFKKIKNYK